MQRYTNFVFSRVKSVPILISVLLFAALITPNVVFARTPCDTAEQLFSNLSDDAAERLDELTQAVELCPTFLNRYEQGVAYLELRKPDSALISFNAAKGHLADANPSLLGNLYGRIAQAYHALGNRAKAVAYVDYAKGLLEDNMPAWLSALRMQIDDSATRSIWKAVQIQDTLDTKGSFFVSSGRSENRPSSSQSQVLAVQILFEFNSARLNGSGARQADEIGNALGKYIDHGKSVQIIGHTDVRGDQYYNQRLSEQRAQSVVIRILSAHPTFRGHLQAVGKGEAEPRYTGKAERAHQLNRRVEIRLVSK